MVDSEWGGRRPFPRQPILARDPTAKLSYCSITGWYSALKMRVQIPFESLPERDLLLVLDVDPAVASFAAQPETFRWTDGTGKRRYTPDARVTFINGRILYVQAKLLRKRDRDPSLRGRLPDIEAQCALRGAEHEIWTEADIRRQPRLANVRKVRGMVRTLNDASVYAVRSACARLTLPASLAELASALGNQPEFVNAALGLVAIGELAVDLDDPIGPDCLIWKGSHS